MTHALHATRRLHCCAWTAAPRLALRALSLAALCVASSGAAPLASQPSAGPMPNAEPVPGDYRVVGHRVDPGTHTGWRLFHTSCHACHGVDAVGSDLAPSLVERIKSLTPRAFATRVLTNYRIVQPADASAAIDRGSAQQTMIDEVMRRDRSMRSTIVMPAWETHPTVNPHVLDLYAYLSARADGKLGPGEPQLLVQGTGPQRGRHQTPDDKRSIHKGAHR